MYRLLLVTVCLLSFSACIIHKKASKSKQVVIDLGMTHDSVRSLVEDRSEVLVAEFNFKAGHMNVYQYAKYGKAGYQTARYVMYFLNDTLYRKSEPEDFQKGAHLALKARKQYFIDRDEAEKAKAEREARMQEQKKRREEMEARREEMRSKRSAHADDEGKHKKHGLFGKKKHKEEDDEEEDEKEK